MIYYVHIDQKGVVLGAQLKVRESEGFHRRQSHDLAKLLREMNKESKPVLDVLLTLMKSEDEKIKLEAVKTFLNTYKDVAREINEDQLRRLLANAKFGGPKELEFDEDDTPQVNFNDIQDVN